MPSSSAGAGKFGVDLCADLALDLSLHTPIRAQSQPLSLPPDRELAGFHWTRSCSTSAHRSLRRAAARTMMASCPSRLSRRTSAGTRLPAPPPIRAPCDVCGRRTSTAYQQHGAAWGGNTWLLGHARVHTCLRRCWCECWWVGRGGAGLWWRTSHRVTC